MAVNPMQRKAKNSFLLGMLITLLITGIIIALLIMQLTKMQKEKQEAQAQIVRVYVAMEDINSGDIVSTDKLTLKEIDSSLVPQNKLSSGEIEARSQLFDNDGNLVKTIELISKINIKRGTVITSDMLVERGELTSDMRKQEYNIVVLPTQLQNGEYIDIRLRTPEGKDYIVVSYKQVEIPTIEGVDSESSIWLKLSEEEILSMSNAIVEAYTMEGSILYATRYVEPGMQDPSTPTYLPSDAVIKLMQTDSNITDTAKNALFSRYNSTKSDIRTNGINKELNKYSDDATDNVETSVEQEITKLQEERQKYLESLGGY